MSTYELSDALVANIVNSAEAGKVESHLIAALLSDLKPQIPIPVPTKIGAVVRTKNRTAQIQIGTFLRWATDPQTVEPWVCVGDRDLGTYRSDDLGRITEVLSEGVDL